ncbi:hypothetical protein PVAR5_6148 [Paecilomyces variotii No. 5]|uniref:Uncharacterized protein n=1 Tax=Byssochlamys spectabilis (strain No. 5 / NBRC 109023) TaxID=1356009 RepID=V5FZG5_BYSSN|nr:hypothetical protein PVAR5_6148 [Paecilomyces variotii No. 5]
MVLEGHDLRETMPSNPRVEGTNEVDELCRYMRSLLVLDTIDKDLETRFEDIPPEFEPSLMARVREQPNPMDTDEDDDQSFGLSGIPGSAINGDPARLSRRRRVDEERHRALEAAEIGLRESGDVSQTPREYFINPRTIEWVRGFYESSPDAPEEYDVTQSTTSPVPLGMIHGYDPDDYENSIKAESTSSDESPPQVQYMAHNRRWGLRDVDVIPTIEEESSADIRGFEEGEIKEESDSMDWKPDVPSEGVDDADEESNADAEELPLNIPIIGNGRIRHTRDAPSPPASSQPSGTRRHNEAGRATVARYSLRTKGDTAKENKPASKSRKRQRLPCDNGGGSGNEQCSSKRQRPLRRSRRLAEAGKASSI